MQTSTNTNILELMRQTNGLLEGHFELSSGAHSDQYFQCAKLLQYPNIAEIIGYQLAQLIKTEVDTIISPAVGGLIIGHEVAKSLGKRFIFVERKNDTLSLRRGFEINNNENVFIIEDVITTAKSALETALIVKQHGGIIKGYGCIIDRTNKSRDLTISSLLKAQPKLYQPDNCPLCKQNIALEKPGSKKIINKDLITV
ncbi:MAG: orotate phosphoribosyltransferase [Vampirovibrionia bacterium]